MSRKAICTVTRIVTIIAATVSVLLMCTDNEKDGLPRTPL